MKQRLLKALSLAAIALCSVSTVWADRVAPTLPPAVEPQNEQCYWIYCPEAAKFMATALNNGSVAVLSTQGHDVYLVNNNDQWELHKNSLSGYYLYAPNASDGHMTWQNNKSTYNFIKNGLNYNIQKTGKTTFIGYNESNNNLYERSETAVDWQFMAADKAAHYAAEKALYDALIATDGRSWMRDQYEQMYNNRATATNLELHQAAKELINALNLNAVSGLFDPQNDYTNLMIGSSQEWKVSGNNLLIYLNPGESAAIIATVETTEKADLSYRIRNYNDPVRVYVDGEEVRTVVNESSYGNSGRNWFEALEPGKHTIKWLYENTTTSEHGYYFDRIGVENTPLITVNCPLPGSLGTEILYNVDGLKDVRNLKVIGDLNDDDMTRLTMLTNAHYIDLSEATCTADVPQKGFYNHIWLHTLHLAEGTKSIGADAFSNSVLENITLPSTLKSIKNSAFYNSNLKTIVIPNSVTSMEGAVFKVCYNLENVTYSNGLTSVPNSTFENCTNLKPFEIPEGVTTIDSYAFYKCSKYFVPTLPSTLNTIGYQAFSNCSAIKTLVIPDAVSSIDGYAFFNCYGLEEIIMPMNLYKLTGNYILNNCSKLKKLTLNSPTLVKKDYDSWVITDDEYRSNITLCVPEYLVVPYKLDSYWYNFGDIVGFPSEHIKDYTLHTDLYLDGHSRINGDPNLTIENGALRIEGDAAMGITNFQTTTAFKNSYHNDNFSSLSQVRSGCENITIKGDYTHWMKLYGSRWAFVSLPFDCKVSDITDLTEGRLHAVRYYDGAERAATGTGSSWKKFASEDAIIPAGQGFIIQVDGDGYYKHEYNWIQFKSQNNASKQYVFSKKEFSKALQKNPSVVESNQGWNLVGNPYLCYYNIHNLNFTAPITVWNGENRTYNAYSIIDDDYALRPNEAFFVQCPSALDAITFPVGGKQFDATILTQNASQRRAAATSSRKMLNLTLSNDEATDQTRIVINDEASLGYETTCDASKFMSMDNTVAQLYTLDAQGTQYAINERPYDDGFVQLGASFATDGTYTIALTRGDMDSVFLTDLETGETTDLTLCEYTFHAAAGTDNGRFLLSFAGEGTLTAIEALTNSSAAEYYTIDGRHMGNSRDALRKGVYVVRNGNRSAKILVD